MQRGQRTRKLKQCFLVPCHLRNNCEMQMYPEMPEGLEVPGTLFLSSTISSRVSWWSTWNSPADEVSEQQYKKALDSCLKIQKDQSSCYRQEITSPSHKSNTNSALCWWTSGIPNSVSLLPWRMAVSIHRHPFLGPGVGVFPSPQSCTMEEWYPHQFLAKAETQACCFCMTSIHTLPYTAH